MAGRRCFIPNVHITAIVDRRAKVLLLIHQALKPVSLIRAFQLGLRLLGKRKEPVTMPLLNRAARPTLHQPIQGVLADRLQQTVARGVTPLFRQYQALIA